MSRAFRENTLEELAYSIAGKPILPAVFALLREFGLEPREHRIMRSDIRLETALQVGCLDTAQGNEVTWITVRTDDLSADNTIQLWRESLTEKYPDRVPKPKPAETPRVTPADIKAEISSEHYFTAAQGFEKAVQDEANLPLYLLGEPDREPPPELHLLTFCVLVLRNGCKVVGINHGPVDPANFDAEHGRRDAREDAIRQVWPLLGFRLRDRLASEAPRP